MKYLYYIIFFILALSVNSIQAQDKIFKKNLEVVFCKIHNISTRTVEYTQPNFHSGVTFSILKKEVDRIEFEDGTTMDFKEVQRSPEDYQSQSKNILKLDFFALATGNLTIGYERSLGLERSFEASLGIIGIGTNIEEVQGQGAFLRAGYKLMRSPEDYNKANHYSHIMKGLFIRPDFVFSFFGQNQDVYYNEPNTGISRAVTEKVYKYSFALFVNVGKQWVKYDKVAVSYFVGVGYSISTDDGYYFSHITGGNQYPIAGQAGLTIGFLY